MDVREARDGLRQKAERVLYLVEEKRAALAVQGHGRKKALSSARLHMLRGLNELVLFKEDHILLPILLERDNGLKAVARRLKDRNLDLQHRYDRFVQRWLSQDALSVDGAYGTEAAAMMALIEDEVRLDIVAIDDLLDRIKD